MDGFVDAFQATVTPIFIATALASGIGLGIINRVLWPERDNAVFVFRATFVALLWYTPQVVRVWVEPASSTSTPGRLAGAMVVMLVAFVLPAWLVVRWRSRG